jgi:hypothetical protein
MIQSSNESQGGDASLSIGRRRHGKEMGEYDQVERIELCASKFIISRIMHNKVQNLFSIT